MDKLKHVSHEVFQRLNWLPMAYRFKQCVNSLFFKYLFDQCCNFLNEQFDVATERNFQRKDSFCKLKCTFRKTYKTQFALSYIGATFWSKTLNTLKLTNNLTLSNII